MFNFRPEQSAVTLTRPTYLGLISPTYLGLITFIADVDSKGKRTCKTTALVQRRHTLHCKS